MLYGYLICDVVEKDVENVTSQDKWVTGHPSNHWTWSTKHGLVATTKKTAKQGDGDVEIFAWRFHRKKNRYAFFSIWGNPEIWGLQLRTDNYFFQKKTGFLTINKVWFTPPKLGDELRWTSTDDRPSLGMEPPNWAFFSNHMCQAFLMHKVRMHGWKDKELERDDKGRQIYRHVDCHPCLVPSPMFLGPRLAALPPNSRKIEIYHLPI